MSHTCIGQCYQCAAERYRLWAYMYWMSTLSVEDLFKVAEGLTREWRKAQR
jgi:hypothetical protein